jgi:hypothetical protein
MTQARSQTLPLSEEEWLRQLKRKQPSATMSFNTLPQQVNFDTQTENKSISFTLHKKYVISDFPDSSVLDDTIKQLDSDFHQVETASTGQSDSDLEIIDNFGSMKNRVGDSKCSYIRHSVIGDGGGYTAFGITRQQALELLTNNLNEIRTILQPAINELLLTEEFYKYLIDNDCISSAISHEKITRDLTRYGDNLNVLQWFLHYDVRDKKRDGGWSHPSTLQALAHICHLGLRIWRLGGQEQLVPHRGPLYDYAKYAEGTVDQWIDLLFTDGNHFDRLEIISETEELEEKIYPLNSSQNYNFEQALTKRMNFLTLRRNDMFNNLVELTDINTPDYQREIIAVLTKFSKGKVYKNIISNTSSNYVNRGAIVALANKYFIDVMNKLNYEKVPVDRLIPHLQASAYYLAMYSYDAIDADLRKCLLNPIHKDSKEDITNAVILQRGLNFDINALEPEDRETIEQRIYTDWENQTYKPKLEQVVNIITAAFGKAENDRISMGRASIKNTEIMDYLLAMQRLLDAETTYQFHNQLSM